MKAGETEQAPGDVAAWLARAREAFADARLGDARDAARRALPLAMHDAERVEAATLRARSLYRLGDLRAVVEESDDALAVVPAPEYLEARFELLRIGCLAGCELGEFEPALRHAHEAHQLAQGDAGREIQALVALAACFERLGDPWQAIRLMDEALLRARTEGRDYDLFVTQNNLGAALIGCFHLLRDAGDMDGALAAMQRARELAREAVQTTRRLGESWYVAVSEGNLAETEFHLGEYETARARLVDAMAQAAAGGFEAQRWRMACTLGEVQLARGEVEAAAATLAETLRGSQATQPRATLLRLHHALYRVALARGDDAQALAQLQAYQRLERLRTTQQLRAQSRLLVTRFEMERERREADEARRDAVLQGQRAAAMEDAALRDPLTGLHNRRGLDRQLARLRAAVPGPLALAVAMLDIDHFKLVNDRHGHVLGDRVLVRIAALLRQHLRPGDVLARVGGEEFAVVLCGLAPGPARAACERLCQQVQAAPWDELAAGLQITLSLGVVTAEVAEAPGASGFGAMFEEADALLYRAKHAGRNRMEAG